MNNKYLGELKSETPQEQNEKIFNAFKESCEEDTVIVLIGGYSRKKGAISFHADRSFDMRDLINCLQQMVEDPEYIAGERESRDNQIMALLDRFFKGMEGEEGDEGTEKNPEVQG